MNTMKFTYIIILASILSLTSCKKLLKESPEYSLNGQTVFFSKQSAQMALNACYGYMASSKVYGQNLLNATERASGIWCTRFRDNALSRYGQQIFSADDQQNGTTWEGLYKAINECNGFIMGVEESEIAEKAQMAAQAKFLRGLAYYNLVLIYGGVPLRIGASSASTIHMSRASKADVFNQVIKDFTESAQALNDIETDSSVPSKIAAYAMLAKTYFQMASSEGENSAYWQKAKDAGTKVFDIVGATPSLEANFATLFNETTTSSVESIFKLNFSMNGLAQSLNKLSYLYSPIGSTVAGVNYGEAWITKSFFNYFKLKHPGDPRINASFFNTNYFRKKTSDTAKLYPRSPLPRNNYAWPYSKKHYDSRQVGENSAHTFIVYRYADFLLLMADVENELGNSDKAIEYVNRVLLRARNSISPAATQPADLSTGISKADLRQIIFDERIFELNQEGHTFMELRRRGYDFYKPYLDRHNADTDTRSSFTVVDTYVDRPMPTVEADIRKALLMPIPNTEINTNEKITPRDQNPGY